jgi:hypothetical protein
MLRRIRSDERGFSMVTLMLMLAVGSLFAVAAYSTTVANIPLTRDNSAMKKSYGAAEAGISYYLYHLNANSSFWTRCDNVPAPGSDPSPIAQRWSGSGTDTRDGHWRTLPGSRARYAIELLPQNGRTSCVQNDSASMIDANTGTMQIRSTGVEHGKARSVVATMRRRGFLDFLYFTDYETSDPVTYQATGNASWAQANCSTYRAGRSSSCRDIVFGTDDVLAGPMHTNDDILTCGTPDFGRATASPPDAIEVSGPSPGYRDGCGGGTSPRFLGGSTLQTGTAPITMPATNQALHTIAEPNYRFQGKTWITLSGNAIRVTNAAAGLSDSSLPWPSNGVISVTNNGTCGSGYDFYQDYDSPATCGDVHVNGTYNRSLTLAAENDVIVNGSVLNGGSAVLGMIAQNFVRVYRPVRNRSGNSCSRATGTLGDVRIEAAILALQHSFIVDNYYCGGDEGMLTVVGAIAQKFRGPVGTTNGNGYTKNYIYDDRLKTLTPPYFLDPVQSQWHVIRYHEQVPAAAPES